jgi:hypothetical protein
MMHVLHPHGPERRLPYSQAVEEVSRFPLRTASLPLRYATSNLDRTLAEGLGGFFALELIASSQRRIPGRSSAIDGRTTRHAGCALSQRTRKRIEKAFGGIKTTDGRERTKVRGRERVG